MKSREWFLIGDERIFLVELAAVPDELVDDMIVSTKDSTEAIIRFREPLDADAIFDLFWGAFIVREVSDWVEQAEYVIGRGGISKLILNKVIVV